MVINIRELAMERMTGNVGDGRAKGKFKGVATGIKRPSLAEVGFQTVEPIVGVCDKILVRQMPCAPLPFSPGVEGQSRDCFEDSGFSGLREGPREGRPRRLDDRTWEKVERDLRVHPRDLGYNHNLWDGRLLAHHLRQKYQVSLGTRQCQRLFRSTGFRRRKPRPLIAQADPVAQEAFKKTRRAGKKSGAGPVELG
jgi:transposase